MHKHYLLQQSLLLALLSALSFSCKSSPTGPHITQNLQLSAYYVTCTEVWLKLGFTGNASGGEYKITRDTTTVLTGGLSSANTVVIDTTAEPEMTYTYRAYRIVNNEVSDTSLPIQVTTMDSTSNNWTFESWTFGSGNGSMFNDATIINDTLAYAVGAIYLNDSTGQNDPFPYNLAIWNGNSWSPRKIVVLNNGNEVDAPFYGIFAFSPSDIWISSGLPVHWDGNAWTQFQLYDSGILGANDGYLLKPWGADSRHVYLTGTNGTLVYYDGYTWNKIPSAITSTINDVWGVSTGSTATVFAVSLTQGIFALTANTATSALDWPGGDIGSIWFADTSQIYVGGDGVYTKDVRGWRRIYYRPGMYVNGIRGSGPNNIFAVGWGVFAHFNGSTWQEYPDIESSANLWSVAVTKDMVVAVGFTGGGPYMSGFVIIGRDN